MKLGELIEGAGLDPVAEGFDAEVSELAYRSADVVPGTLFFCVPGFTADGHDFAADAIARGACALVCERPLELGVPEVVVESVRVAMAPIAAQFFGDPTAELEMVGVTGTNGKTTTAFLAWELLGAAGRQAGLLGTVHSIVGGKVEEVERTTPEAVDLQRSFRRMVDAGDRACAMEVSSHALALHRTDAIHFDCAVFTNLTQDHLDFHGTLEDYFGAKVRLFAPQRGPAPRTAIVNADDAWGARLVEELAEAGHPNATTFAIRAEDADYRAEQVRLEADGSRFACRASDGKRVEVRIGLPGLFNVYNALGALAACHLLGVDLETGAAALGRAGQVPGRFEPIDEGQDFSVLVDYAHTPDSLVNVLRAAREVLEHGPGGRLICVFGAGGDRDRDKRPLMGEAARRNADHVIVTSDNPRSEDPDAIIAAIVEGAERPARDGGEWSTLTVEPDRRRAIAKALEVARAGDVVVIAGKGHEQGQEFAGGRKVPFDDRDVAREELVKAGIRLGANSGSSGGTGDSLRREFRELRG
jgi:UDP-N-acetylmuramoyl-L-alanyl-D-glutamate--2,6-diaminopimelate ligase